MRRLINGNNNVSVGNNAGSLNEDGSFLTDVANSVFIGNGARSQANGQNNQIVIGNGAIGNGASTVTIGNDAISSTFLKGTVNAADMDITGTLTVGGEAITPGGGGFDPDYGVRMYMLEILRCKYSCRCFRSRKHWYWYFCHVQ